MNESYYPISYQNPQQIESLIQRIASLEKEFETLQASLNETSAQPEVHYHYTFEQMKIEKLEGTLTIGTPASSDGQPFEDLAIEDQRIEGPANLSDIKNNFTPMTRDLITYTQKVIKNSEEKDINLKIPGEMKQLILKDIQSQLPERLSHYLKQGRYNGLSQEQANEKAVAACQKDIDKAIQLFLLNYNNQGGDKNDF